MMVDEVYEGMLVDASEEDLTKEMDVFDKYHTRYFALKQKCNDHEVNRSAAESSIRTNTCRREFKLPTIQLKKFTGDLKNWFPFWSQFKQHEDPAISENYNNIIDCLQSTFGREDLQIEVYFRELLKLVLNRFTNKRCNASVLYDNIESQLRSFETLGIISDKYVANMYPMIESFLSENMIRLWHRSSEFL